jgi:mRNA interferase MazF
VVVVPFPFTEKPGAKRRPPLVLSNSSFNASGHAILAMVTTRARPPWPGDTVIRDMQGAGLRVPCIVRLKLFTLDDRLILRVAGNLSEQDRAAVAKHPSQLGADVLVGLRPLPEPAKEKCS